MNVKPIRNDDDLRAAFKRLELVYHAQEGTPEADETEVLVTLVEAYEHKHFPVGSADPVEAIEFRMEQQVHPKRPGALHRLKWLCFRSVEPQASAKFANGEVAARRIAYSL